MHAMQTDAVTACVNAMLHMLFDESIHSWHHSKSTDTKQTHHVHAALPHHAPL